MALLLTNPALPKPETARTLPTKASSPLAMAVAAMAFIPTPPCDQTFGLGW
jgi:hypothetical protein